MKLRTTRLPPVTTPEVCSTHPSWTQAAKDIAAWHPCTWPQQGLQQTDLLVIQERLGCPGSHWWNPVGYIWLSPVYSTDHKVVELHLCARPEYHGRWLTPRVLRDGFQFMSDSRARYVIALHMNQEYRDLLDRLGWETHGDFVSVLDMENHHGILILNLRRGRRRASSSSST